MSKLKFEELKPGMKVTAKRRGIKFDGEIAIDPRFYNDSKVFLILSNAPIADGCNVYSKGYKFAYSFSELPAAVGDLEWIKKRKKKSKKEKDASIIRKFLSLNKSQEFRNAFLFIMGKGVTEKELVRIIKKLEKIQNESYN